VARAGSRLDLIASIYDTCPLSESERVTEADRVAETESRTKHES
jgi:hypothetical protein